MISPIVILLISEVFEKKDLKLDALLSIILIGALTYNFFVVSEENLIQNDLEKIIKDYPREFIVADLASADLYASFLWKDKPEVVWLSDFFASKENRTSLREGYRIAPLSDLMLREKLEISAGAGIIIVSFFI